MRHGRSPLYDSRGNELTTAKNAERGREVTVYLRTGSPEPFDAEVIGVEETTDPRNPRVRVRIGYYDETLIGGGTSVAILPKL